MPCGKFWLNRFLLDFNQAFCSRVSQTRQAQPVLGLANSLNMHFLVGRASPVFYINCFGERGITCLLPTINLESINLRRARKTSFSFMYHIRVHDICSPRTFVPQISHRAHIASMPSKLSEIVALIYGYIHINLGSNTRSVVSSRHLGNKCPWGTNIMDPSHTNDILSNFLP